MYKDNNKFEDGMQELYEKLNKFNLEIAEVISDINEVQEMISTNNIDLERFYEIAAKYPEETQILINMEKLFFANNTSTNNYIYSYQNDLLNLRHRLYRVAIYKILREEGISVTKEIVSKDYRVLINLIEFIEDVNEKNKN